MTWWQSFCGSAHVVVAIVILKDWLERDQCEPVSQHVYLNTNIVFALFPGNMQLCAYSHYCNSKTAVMWLPLRTLVATVFQILRDNGLFFSAAMHKKWARLNATADHTETLDVGAVLKEFAAECPTGNW